MNYESLSLSDVWSGLVEGEFATSAEPTTGKTSSPDITVVFVGHYVNPLELEQARAVRTAVEKSSSRLLLPNVAAKEDVWSAPDSIAQKLGGRLQVLGACAKEEGLENISENVERAFIKSSDGPTMVLICSPLKDADSETSDFQEVVTALEKSGREHVFMYIQDAEEERLESAHKRSLLADAAVFNGECDSICQTQVKFLEAIILALVLSFALAAGLCCTHILDGPSQFEKPEAES